MQAVQNFHHRSRVAPTFRSRKMVELEAIAQILNRAQSRVDPTNSPPHVKRTAGLGTDGRATKGSSNITDVASKDAGLTERKRATCARTDGPVSLKRKRDSMQGTASDECSKAGAGKHGEQSFKRVDRKEDLKRTRELRRDNGERETERTGKKELGGLFTARAESLKERGGQEKGESKRASLQNGARATSASDSVQLTDKDGHNQGGKLGEQQKGARARWFERQVWDDSKQHHVVKRGTILEGPLSGKRTTRQSLYRVKHEDGKEEETTLRSNEILYEDPGAGRGATMKAEPFRKETGGSPAMKKKETAKNRGYAATKTHPTDEKSRTVERGETQPVALDGELDSDDNGETPKPWRSVEVGWFLERLRAHYGASHKGFQEAWRVYEVRVLPEGVTMECKKRKSGDRVDKYYIYQYETEGLTKTFRTDSSVKLQQFFDEMGSGAPVDVLFAPLSRGGRGRARGKQLSPQEFGAVRARIGREGWRTLTKERQAGVTAGGQVAQV
jgi:hypothetical protein